MAVTKVVIIGAGVAGVSCARTLQGDKRFAVTLINDSTDFSYPPASLGDPRLSVVIPLKKIFANPRNIKIVVDRVSGVDPGRRLVRTSQASFIYDELVVAVGAERPAVKLRDALRVIGAGPLGVELAADLASRGKTVELHESAPRILQGLPERFARRIAARLEELGVKTYTSSTVKDAGAGDINSIGNRPPAFLVDAFGSLKDAGLKVDEFLAAAEHVWAAGDAARTDRSGFASTAAYDGRYIAQNLKRLQQQDGLRAYSPPAPVVMLPVGPQWCAVNYRARQLYGYTGWLARRWTDLQLLATVLPRRLALAAWLSGRRES